MEAIFQSYTHDYNAAPIWWCSLNVYLVRVTGCSKLYFTFLVSEKELGSLKATGGDNATSLPNGCIPEAAGKLSEITGYFHLSVINFAPSVLFCIILLLNEHHWNYKSKTANYVEKRMMLKQFYWKCIIWPEHCHEATRMIIWPEIVMTPAGWSYDLNIVMKPPGMIIWPEHCHESPGNDHMTWTLSWSRRDDHVTWTLSWSIRDDHMTCTLSWRSRGNHMTCTLSWSHLRMIMCILMTGTR